ncbi:ABC transporter ATP-binding protein [Thermoanaerobacterium thermosaccharolyticum]|uniref:ABC-type multidrug transport system, ATPase component n=1 Tax=Thermoanaerobacterium thermosaccharolyticum M0795 TaxID=698948 RepID=L0IEP5_THETR|nr:ABC transporter ATP-binding protein [Thermoanaerobacterium thermosaccharolyticum]AGB18020.1 ABC-type multidrug transport system, ATPase component [Thermoanaerobacterium thermosaccharolyticum M0795]
MILETQNLTKQFDGKGGFKDVNISIDSGMVFGFLGPNGAGKSTFVKTMVGLLYPTSGFAWINGFPIGTIESKRKIGFLPENFKYYDWMTGKELMKFHAELYKMKNPDKKIEELLDLVKLKGHENKKIKNYSKGMQQRIGLAIALLNDPKVIFLDEPTSALDPVGRIDVREIIKRLKDDGKTVFLNSHLLSEVEMICDEVAIINHGHVIAEGKLKNLLSKNTYVEMVISDYNSELIEKISKLAYDIVLKDGKLTFKVKDKDSIPEIAKIVVDSGAKLYQLDSKTSSLEDLFINIVGKDEDVC